MHVFVCVCAFGVNRRTTAPPLHESGEKQGDHLHLSGPPYAHLPLATQHPPAAEESPGASGKDVIYYETIS